MSSSDTPNCEGNSCLAGHISARKASATEDNSQLEKVKLSKGIVGYYDKNDAPGSKEPNILSFVEKGTEYDFGLHVSKEALIQVANSAIDAGPR
jgi:hypothetical protein